MYIMHRLVVYDGPNLLLADTSLIAGIWRARGRANGTGILSAGRSGRHREGAGTGGSVAIGYERRHACGRKAWPVGDLSQPPSGIPIEAQIKEPLEIAIDPCDLRAGELPKVCGGTGVIDMGVRDEQQPDVLWLEAKFFGSKPQHLPRFAAYLHQSRCGLLLS